MSAALSSNSIPVTNQILIPNQLKGHRVLANPAEIRTNQQRKGNPPRQVRNRPDNRPQASGPGTPNPSRSNARSTRRGSTRPPGALTHLPMTPVRVVRVGEPGLDHPLRPITEPEELTVGDPTEVAATVVRAAVEVLDGRRSLSQIRGWLTPQVALQLAERTRLELALPTRESTGGPIRIRKVHVVRFGDRAEAAVLVDMSARTRAAAARLEARQGAWRVSVLEIA